MDILDKIVRQNMEAIENGYYNVNFKFKRKNSLKNTLNNRKFSLIGEIKIASPVDGKLRDPEDIENMVEIMERYCGGISVITESRNFMGSLKRFVRVREITDLPMIMKDFIVSSKQIDAAERIGADTVLLIFTLAERKYFDLNKMIDYAHKKGIEVLLEVHTEKEMKKAVETEADIIGINNRDLSTMKTDISNTCRILRNFYVHKPVISESGFSKKEDILRVKNLVNGVLVGKSLMISGSIEEKLRDLSCG